jgi:hypothetical protein
VAEQGGRRRRFEDPVADGGQVRVDVAQSPAGLGVGGDDAQLDVGVAHEQPDDLTAGVSARAGDCCGDHAA